MRRAIRPVISLVVATLIWTACAGRPSSTSSGSSGPTIAPAELQGTILFTRAGGKYGDETIYTANADGTNERRITDFGATCCPRWTSDGNQILIAELDPDGKRITTGIINPDGSLDHKVPLPPGTLNLGPGTWYPDGTRIAFQGWDDTDPSKTGIYIGRASDGGDLVRVTSNPQDGGDLPMDVSRDGTKIFFFRSVEGFPSIGDQLDGSLFVVNADGTDLHRVTPANMPVEAPGNSGGRLSSDGRWIVFTSSGVIWKVHSDGSGLMKVFEDPDGGQAITPTWSPDGRFIMFGLDPPNTLATVDEAPANVVDVIRADGTELTPVVATDDWKREPGWVAGS